MTRTPPEQYVSKVKKPADFEDFWKGVLDQVADISLIPETVPDPLRSSDDVEVFQVYYTSIDNVRIAG